MLQHFDSQSSSQFSETRLNALRGMIRESDADAFLVPRADRFMGEYVAAADERLAWLTGFSGSAGMAIVTEKKAALFVDGRYTIQAADQVNTGLFDICALTQEAICGWLAEALPKGSVVGFDGMLHPSGQIAGFEGKLPNLDFTAIPNPIDAIWHDRPAPPTDPAFAHPTQLAGEASDTKRRRVGKEIAHAGAQALLLTAPDNLCWLLNIRGNDIPRVPVVHAMALVYPDGRTDLFSDPAKYDADLRAYLGDNVRIVEESALIPQLEALETAPVMLSESTAPAALVTTIRQAGCTIINRDPVTLFKARKNAVEMQGARDAHRRDGIAMIEFLHWFEAEAPKGTLTEVDVIQKLEGFRHETGALKDISFDTICGAGPNGAIVHYRATHDSNRPIARGDVVLVDSGGQYVDGTTDITRTLPTGDTPQEVKDAYTRVLKGLIAVSTLRWPEGRSGRELEAFARHALWQAGQDYAHGTGHGVGSYLSVHEGPQGLSTRADTPLQTGMILSNEPGYYREGAFGIRLENLILVEPAKPVKGGDIPMMGFETLTFTPFSRELVNLSLLAPLERDWLNAYHCRVQDIFLPLVKPATAEWLKHACAAL